MDTYPPVQLRAGDKILLCTDGLWGMVPPARIGEILRGPSCQLAVDALVAEANNAGGHDNITAIACGFAGSALDSDDESTQLVDPLHGEPP